jgi:hypothetical protein
VSSLFGRDASAGVSRRLFALGLGPLDHVDMSAVDALKQQNRGESVVEPGQLPGELHARRATTTDQRRLWLVIQSGSLAFATKQGISYPARRSEPLRWWGIGLAFGGSDVSATSA